MEQNKTTCFARPNKRIGNDGGLKLKLFATIVRRGSFKLLYLFLVHIAGANLTIEVLRRNLHKIQEEKESLPSISHILQRLPPIQHPKPKLLELWLFESRNFWK